MVLNFGTQNSGLTEKIKKKTIEHEERGQILDLHCEDITHTN